MPCIETYKNQPQRLSAMWDVYTTRSHLSDRRSKRRAAIRCAMNSAIPSDSTTLLCNYDSVNRSEIKVFHIERVLLDKLSARFNHVAHKFGKEIISLRHIVNLDLQKRARLWIKRRLPKLIRVHFS